MITIYTIPKCGNCLRAKSLFNKKGIDYEEISLAKKENREARKFYRNLGIKSVPIIVEDDWIMTEYDEELLDRHIDELLIKERLRQLGYLE